MKTITNNGMLLRDVVASTRIQKEDYAIIGVVSIIFVSCLTLILFV